MAQGQDRGLKEGPMRGTEPRQGPPAVPPQKPAQSHQQTPHHPRPELRDCRKEGNCRLESPHRQQQMRTAWTRPLETNPWLTPRPQNQARPPQQ